MQVRARCALSLTSVSISQSVRTFELRPSAPTNNAAVSVFLFFKWTVTFVCVLVKLSTSLSYKTMMFLSLAALLMSAFDNMAFGIFAPKRGRSISADVKVISLSFTSPASIICRAHISSICGVISPRTPVCANVSNVSFIRAMVRVPISWLTAPSFNALAFGFCIGSIRVILSPAFESSKASDKPATPAPEIITSGCFVFSIVLKSNWFIYIKSNI